MLFDHGLEYPSGETGEQPLCSSDGCTFDPFTLLWLEEGNGEPSTWLLQESDSSNVGCGETGEHPLCKSTGDQEPLLLWDFFPCRLSWEGDQKLLDRGDGDNSSKRGDLLRVSYLFGLWRSTDLPLRWVFGDPWTGLPLVNDSGLFLWLRFFLSTSSLTSNHLFSFGLEDCLTVVLLFNLGDLPLVAWSDDLLIPSSDLRLFS